VVAVLSTNNLPLAAGLAVRNAAADLAGAPGVQLKWPNDVLYEGRKLAGLLCERVHGADLVGVGLNVNVLPGEAPPALRGRVTSLAEVAGRAFDMTDVLARVAGELRATLGRLAEAPFAALLEEYDRHHALVGRDVRITKATATDAGVLAGRCTGLDHMGRLLVRAGRQTHAVLTGHVEMA